MEYPRTTEVLRNFTGYEYVPKQTLENAAARGTTVHALCAAIAKGEWIPESMIDEDLRGYVKSFKDWAFYQVEAFVVVEKRFTNEVFGYTGQVDFVIKGTDNELHLVDIKTSASKQKTYPVQMAAYRSLLMHHGIQIKSAMIIYLDKNAEFPNIHVMEDFTEEFNVFLSALECWKYFNKGKLNGNNKELTPENTGSNERT
jgi:hypothetical protein